MTTSGYFPAVASACLALFSALPSAAAELPTVKPETVGFSSDRLALLEREMRKLVDDGELAGIVTLVARRGQVVHSDAYGSQDVASTTSMRADSIFRIFSMTKPITGVAMMLLYERGQWHPDDPLAKHIPKLEGLRVYAGSDASGEIRLTKPVHAPTIGELLTHTAGFTYGLFGQTPVDELYRRKDLLGSPTPEVFIRELAALPLEHQPGAQWEYSIGVDVQGYLVEKLSGQSLPEFMRTEIFEPLDMRDTGFAVPESELGRLATIYSYDRARSELVPMARDPDVSKVPAFASGGGGLYSTARDYARFATMLANGGELDGSRILAPSTVDLMHTNHLADELLDGRFGVGVQRMREGFGFGYDVAVFYDPRAAGSTVGEGTYLWDGLAGTWFWVDPANDVVFVGMIQRMTIGDGSSFPNVQNLARALTYQALVEP